MNQDRTNRKLAAIFSTDVVGYSRMMEADEAWTIQNLEENKKLMSSLIEGYKGRVVDSPGDNLLAEFGSVVNAVECAVKIQKQLSKKNSRLTEEHQMKFRIGVNPGDVVEEDGKLYGNGVNIAARLESLAEPGGICISRTAYDQVKSKIEVDYDYLGEYQVKNIYEPVRVYRILMGGVSTEKYVLHGKTQKRSIPLGMAITSFIILLAVSVGITISIMYPKSPDPPPLIRYSHELPEDQQFRQALMPWLAVSPDGRQFIYASNRGLYLRSIEEWDAQLVKGTENDNVVFSSFFSPDGKWIAYFSELDNKLKKISVSGGSPIPLCDVSPTFGGGSWIGDKIIFSTAGTPGIMQIPDTGGTPKLLLGKGDAMAFLYPQMLSDGETILFTRAENIQKISIAVGSLETKEYREITAGLKAKYLPTGHLIYSAPDQIGDYKGNIYTIPFDVDKLEATGSPFLLIQNVSGLSGTGFAVSDKGTLVYIPTVENKDISFQRTLVWVDREGNEDILGIPQSPQGFFRFPKISPDGERVALVITNFENSNTEIFIWDEIRKTINKITFDGSSKNLPVWTPDGNRIAYHSLHEDPDSGGVFWKPVDGTVEPEKLASEPDRSLMPYSFTSDGKYLLMQEVLGTTNVDISILSMESDHKRTLLLETEFIERHPIISPDDQYFAYSSNKTGREEIYVSNFPDATKVWQISQNGGTVALWSPDGDKLFYLSLDNSVMVVDIETKPTFNSGTPKVFLQNKYIGFRESSSLWDIHPEGKRFLMMKEPGTDVENDSNLLPKKIYVTLNWFEELKEKVPVD